MTPSLAGRIQTRLLLLLLIGLPITWLWSSFNTDALSDTRTPYIVLFTVFMVGLLLDPIYIMLQRLRWDRDWPFAFQLVSMVGEFLLVLALVGTELHPLIPADAVGSADAITLLSSHFLSVLIPSFLMLLGPLQVLLVRWRFKAGEVGRL